MLVIRLSRGGRKKLPHYRVIVQEKHVSPKRGKVVERLGEYNALSKELDIDKDRVKHFLDNGAQPSNRVARILKDNKFKLPDWVVIKEKVSKPKNAPEETEEEPKEEKPEEKSSDEEKEESKEDESEEEKKDDSKEENSEEKEEKKEEDTDEEE